jgi:hypothetical protein
MAGRKRALAGTASLAAVAAAAGAEALSQSAQADAIEERGEHEITLAGVKYLLRPSHAALRTIEKKLNCSQLKLIQRGNSHELLVDELGVIAAELIKAGATDELTQRVSAERIGELIQEEGLLPIVARLTLCLLDAATGGRTASGEAKAATA